MAKTCGSLLKRIGRLPEDKGIEIAHQLCEGLAAVHEKGIVHRDLKPLNIMIDGRGQARLTDFGLAVIADAIPTADFLSGTPGYMAPEQLAGKKPTVQSDLFALGLVLYEIFTGRRAFPAKTREELVRLYDEHKPVPVGDLVPGLDPRVAKVVRHCLEREPSQRPTSIQEVAAGLPKRDPLATALAEGKTPSPEIVANALTRGTLAPPRGNSALGGNSARRGRRRRPGEPGNHQRTGAPETLAARPGRQGAGGFRPPRLRRYPRGRAHTDFIMIIIILTSP